MINKKKIKSIIKNLIFVYILFVFDILIFTPVELFRFAKLINIAQEDLTKQKKILYKIIFKT
jgi:hypothetical protein